MSVQRTDPESFAKSRARPAAQADPRTAMADRYDDAAAPAPRILLAEDDDEMRSVLALHLRRNGYHVTECRTGLELIDCLEGYFADAAETRQPKQYDLVVSDIRMPGVFGLSVAEYASQCDSFPPTILITAFGDAETHATARRYGVKAIFDKPFEMAELLGRIREIVFDQA